MSSVAHSSGSDWILNTLKDVVSGMSGIAPADIDVQTSFLDLGADSLLLVQASQVIQDTFGVKVPMRLLLEDNPSIASLAAYIEQQMPAEVVPAAPSATRETAAPAPTAPAPVATAAPPAPPRSPAPPGPAPTVPRSVANGTRRTRDGERDLALPGAGMEAIISQQLRILAEQLELLRESDWDDDEPFVEEAEPALLETPAPPPAAPSPPPTPSAPASAAPSAGAASEAFARSPYVPYKPINVATGGLTPRQQQHLDALIARVNARTPGSKQLAQTTNIHLADPRRSAGFRLAWKEMLYPLAIRRAEGARAWDIDGNEYVDITMGFGALLFGHSPPFIIEALQRQAAQGLQLGMESPLAGETARLVCELTGMERATFCNSGTEAVMTAIRLARTVTGRDRFALFSGSYHGFADPVLVRGGKTRDGHALSAPMAPGVPASTAGEAVVLDYGTPEALDFLRAHMGELAAVLVEPVQSRQPDLQPIAFLHELRTLTQAAGTALVFDEVITGFRTHPAGVQGLFGIQADIATYGKAAGGGIPVSIVAGKAAYIDAADGGRWTYGDGSYPGAERTYFAGTFFKHPLTMAPVWATLNYLKNNSPQLQQELNERTARMVATLNAFFAAEDVPIRAIHFGSLFRFAFTQTLKYGELLYYHLLDNGVYIPEGRNCFLSTAHTDADIDQLVRAVKQSVAAMRAGEFLPPGPGGAQLPPPTALHTLDQAALAHTSGNGKAAVDTSAPLRSIPTTIAQKGLWIATQVDEQASRAYNESTTLHLRGQLDLDATRRAVQRVVERHESLRTTFSPDGETSFVAPALTLDIPLVDFSEADDQARDAQVAAWLAQEAQATFDLSQGPLLRARLAKLADDYHLLVLTLHHIITDGWSNDVLVAEIGAFYSADRRGVAAELPPVMQYREYVAWLEQQTQGPEMAQAESYWLGQFADQVPVVELPADRPRPPLQTYRGAQQTLTIEEGLLRDLKAVSVRQGSTLFVTMLASFQVLLHRLSGQDDLVVGIPVAGQAAVGVERLIGYCLNLLPLRSRLAGDPPYAEYLAAVKRALLDAYDHQLYPFSQLIQKLNMPRDPSRQPLVTIAFNLDRKPSEGPQLADLTAEVVPNQGESAKYDLSLNIMQREHDLRVDWDYSSDLFDAETIQRWMAHFRTLLRAIAAEPARRVSLLPLLGEAERQQVLAGGNGAPVVYLQDRYIHELFETHAARTPDVVALVFRGQGSGIRGQEATTPLPPPAGGGTEGGSRRASAVLSPQSSVLSPEQLTYAELDRRAGQLARYLSTLGVGPDTLVGLCVERSLEMVIGVLGILKAGGAYVPLDPTYPPDRLAFMLEDSQAAVLITTTDHRPTTNDLRPQSKIQNPKSKIVNLDADWPKIAREGDAQPGYAAGAYLDGDNIAYVIYTSGSTGQPKGVPVSHANVMRLFAATQPWFRFDARDVWTLFHSYAFDFSVWELWGPLFYGGRLVMVSDRVRRAPDLFYNLLCEQRVTVLNQTPSAFRQLIRAAEAPSDAGSLALRLVIFGGEALELRSLRPWFEHYGDRRPRLVNMYGITETTVHVTYRPLTAADARDAVGSPIGVPIPDLRLYVLDRYLQPVPIGVAGELYVGGAGLARGYLGRPDLTAERFVPNLFWGMGDKRSAGGGLGWGMGSESSIPHPPSPIPRLYRTGDLARYLPSGDVEYLGRADHQVKVRGFRIELGEIEAALEGHPAVGEAVVVAREDAPGDKRLVAYVVPKIEDRGLKIEDSASDAPEPLSSILYPLSSELRRFLQARLPDYMIPSAFIMLDALPLTPSGKVDRRALPAPGPARPDLDEAFVAPRTPTEAALARIWSHALGIERVGIHDNFFALGGDSIRGLKVLAEARAGGYNLSLQDLFRWQTIARLAGEPGTSIGNETPAPHTQPFGLISDEDRARLPDDVEDAYPLTMLQLGMYYHMQLTPDVPVYHNVNSVYLDGPFEAEAFQAAVQRVVMSHAAMRTSFDMSSYSQPLQLVHRSAFLPVQVEDLRQLPDHEQERIIAEYVEFEKANRFDMSRPVLMRFCIHRRSDDKFQLTVTDFHLIIDGWGMAEMLTQVSEHYTTLLKGELLPPEPVVEVSFRDYVRLEQLTLESEAARRYWDEVLEDSTPTLLPRWPDVPRISEGPTIRSYPVPLSAEILAGLQRLAQAAAVPFKDVLLAAHLKIMSIASGQTNVTTGLVVDGRLEEEHGERVLGLYLNTLPLRVPIKGGSWADLVNATFQAEVSLLPFRRYPMAALQQRWGDTPPFETAFNFIHFHNVRGAARYGTVKALTVSHAVNDTHYPLLVLFVLDQPIGVLDGTLELQLEYDVNELAEEQIRSIGAAYAIALAQMASEPATPHTALPLLSAEEQRTVLLTWNETANGARHDTCLHELFEAQAAYTPDTVAVVFDRGQGSGIRGQETTARAPGDTFHAPTNDQRPFGSAQGRPTANDRSPLHPFTPSPLQSLTYRELNEHANRLAHHLRVLGVGSETPVGICMERSLEMVIGLLGILKAGGAYVPLDPDYPEERLAFMLEDAQVPVLLTTTDQRPPTNDHRPTTTNDHRPTTTSDDRSTYGYDISYPNDDQRRPTTTDQRRPTTNDPSAPLRAGLRLQSKIQNPKSKIIHLDADWPTIAAASPSNPARRATPGNLAYVIYTSGSTGQPKGAMNSHVAVVNRLRWMQDAYDLTPDDHVLQKTPFSFDVSVWEFFWPLMTGARLVIARPGGHQDSAYLVQTIGEQTITTVHFVPSMLAAFLEEDGLERCAGLRHVICSGEALTAGLQERFFARLGGAPGRDGPQLHNLYGPTEAAVDVTYWACRPGGDTASVPIGHPITNVQTYILDAQGHPAPIGVPGELHIGGVALARGYLGRPDLTAEKFIPNPFTDFGLPILDFGLPEAEYPIQNPKSKIQNGTRLYKTGDLARYLPGGAIEYLGRIDQQVKIRGFRIELGEIEAALSKHPDIRDAVVVAREDLPGSKRLVAYIVEGSGVRGQGSEDAALDGLIPDPRSLIPDLRTFLQKRLPDYMVPAAFVALDALPLTSNGKVNRRALPAPDWAHPKQETELVLPRTQLEQRMAEIWAQVLRVERVGVFDNFFEMGGDSILGIQVITRARQLGLQLTPKLLIQHQTIAELVAMAGTGRAIQAEQGPVVGPVPLTPIQRWFFEQDLRDPQHFNQALLLNVPGRLDPALLAQAVRQLRLHHDALRLRFVRRADGWQQTDGEPDEQTPFTLVDLSSVPEAGRAAALEAAAAGLQASLSLEQGLLLRVALFDFGPHAPSRLLIAVHHMAIDGVSWRILLEDLQTIYLQLQQGKSIQLPPKTTSFKHWAERLVDYARTLDWRQAADYWLDEQRRRVAPLPLDFAIGREANTQASIRTVSVTLSAEETQALLREVPSIYRTQINDALLAALGQTLARWTASPWLLIDLEGHGRVDLFNDVDLSRTVGWFTSIFPVLLELPAAGSPGDMLKSVKEQLRRVPEGGITYGLLRYLNDDPALAEQLRALPQAEVSFNYLGQFDQSIAESALFEPARESSGPSRSPRDLRRYLLEVDSFIAGDQLQLDWRYSALLHRPATVERLAQTFLTALRAIIEHCRTPEAVSFTPADFPLANLNQKALDSILTQVRKSQG